MANQVSQHFSQRAQPWCIALWLIIAPAAGAIGLDHVLWIWWSAMPLLGLTMHLADLQKDELREQRMLWHPTWWFILATWFVVTSSFWWSPDQAVAAGVWWQWTVGLCGCWWIYQVRAQIGHIAILALIFTALFQAFLGITQKLIVFPALIEQIEQAAANNGDNALVNRFGAGQVIERLKNGGAYGSLLLANLFAVYCGVGLILTAFMARNNKLAWFAIIPLAIGIYLSGAKGAVAALIGGSALAWMLADVKKRWWIMPSLALIAAAAWSLSSGLQLSLRVRMDYWVAALGMIMDHPLTGSGIDSFRVGNWEHLPMRAEWSRFPHNTWLMLAVTSGILAPVLAFWAAFQIAWQSRIKSRETDHMATHTTPCEKSHVAKPSWHLLENAISWSWGDP